MPPVDLDTFEDCYRTVFPLVLAKCRRMLRGHSDASDLAQEVFVRLWKHRELVHEPRALTAWLYQASTRLAIDRARQHALSRESLGHFETLRRLEAQEPEAAESRFSSRRQLRSIVEEVPAKELEAAILSRFDRLTQPEIAEVLGVGERTVRRLLERFDARVRTLEETA
jgi:RNA polymerase sigma-70 factor (ECF subfamily)